MPGLALDQPLGLWDGRVFNPSWRGALESSVWTNGTAADQSVGTGTATLADWAQKRSVYWTAGPGPTDPSPPDYAWVGNAATGGLQTTGQLYRRNRHYDPLSGQFTQMDPIGLAGGSSLFGFAAGDPANFSDPFGLCPPELTGRPCQSPLRSPRGTEVSTLTIRSDGNGDGAYGASRRNGGVRYGHAGVDINAPIGTAVASVDQGVVLDICKENCGRMGSFVRVGHFNDSGELVSTSTYGHLSEVNPGLQEGFTVQGGTRLGRVGLTGNAAGTDPHVHIEIRDASGTTQNAQKRLGATRAPKQ